MEVSIVIPTMKGREDMVKKLVSTIPDDCEIIIVDDDDLLLAAKRNKGAALSSGKYLLFIDDDNYLEEDSLNWMLGRFEYDIGVMGITACYDNKKMIVADGGSLRNYLTGFTRGMYTNCKQGMYKKGTLPDWLYSVSEVANAFMIRSEVFKESRGFDEVNFPIDLDEADLCKRIKDMGYRIVMNPQAVCYHKSITYSPIPNFRRPMNAYFMGRNRVLYQRKHNSNLRYLVYLVLFMPVFVGFYLVSLLWKNNPKMIPHFLKGVRDGILNRKQNPYQPKTL